MAGVFSIARRCSFYKGHCLNMVGKEHINTKGVSYLVHIRVYLMGNQEGRQKGEPDTHIPADGTGPDRLILIAKVCYPQPEVVPLVYRVSGLLKGYILGALKQVKGAYGRMKISRSEDE